MSMDAAPIVALGHFLGQVIAPTVVAFGLFLAALWSGSRTPIVKTPVADPPATLEDWRRLVRFLVVTAAGGFGAFLAIVLVFYFALGGQGRGFVADALGSGAMLAFAVVVPSFLAIELVRSLLRRARRRPPAGTEPGPN
jgi:hypothetical protein